MDTPAVSKFGPFLGASATTISVARLVDCVLFYEQLVAAFSTVQDARQGQHQSEFNLSESDHLRIRRDQDDIVVEALYSDPVLYQRMALVLEANITTLRPGVPVTWKTNQHPADFCLLGDPGISSGVMDVETALLRLFFLKEVETSVAERKLLTLIRKLYPINGPASVATAWGATVSILSFWLATEPYSSQLSVDDEWHAATMLLSMMFGAFGTEVRQGKQLPERQSFLTYLRASITIFVRGHARKRRV